ncbi:protein bric-a-brac 1-like [Centruroides sculpturatus]|uniref:protein bric-a-brac 1-like n=1 Tax=Centruroides sculpturatus TaxID=218467 RepID=UPI000C6E3BAC|nr:protein bric-a-brac 1-like [Centruroides sculpturatus]
MGTQQFFLKWNNHCSNMVTIFDQLLMNEALVDVTLACEGLSLKAHKIILSASSPFFQTLFLENPCKHPIVIMKDMKYAELKAVIDFIYKGEVNISHHQLPGLLKIAKELNIKGLMDMSDDTERLPQKSDAENAADKSESILPISVESNYEEFLPRIRKKRKGRRKKNCNSSCSDSEIGQYEIQNFPEIMEEILPESSSNPEHLKASDYHDFSYQSTSQDMYPPSYCQQNEICVYKDEISQDFKESVDEHSNHSESSIITDKKPECQEDTQEQMDSSAECESIVTQIY